MNNENQANAEDLSSENSAWLTSHLKEVREKIIKRANDLLEINGENITTASAISEAANQYAPGTRFPMEDEHGWWKNIISQLSAVTFISAMLAIIFGLIAYSISTGESETASTDARSYIDLVKIFAGAVVGSTGAAVAASAAKKSKK